MPKQDEAARFEAALINTVSKLRLTAPEPALAPFAALLGLLNRAEDPDENMARAARSILEDLHRTYEWARSYDDNWPEWLAFARSDGSPIDLRTGKAPTSRQTVQPRRVFALRREHLPPELEYIYDLATLLWPILPLLNFLHYTRASNAWTASEKEARIWEYAFVSLCTKPKTMWPFLYDLARAVVKRKRKQFSGLDHDKISDIAEAVAESFKRRKVPVSRYKARATTIPGAAMGVRKYMEAAVRRRANDEIRAHLDQNFTIPASTARRWRREHQISVASPDHADEIRKQMAARQTHSAPGRISLAEAARRLKRARSTTMNALRIAEGKHDFTSERGPDGTILLTHKQVCWLKECLPAQRPRRREPSSR